MQVNKHERHFRSACSISRTLDLLGDKWTLLIIRDALFGGAKSFGEFSASPEKIASNILTNRLEKLVANGIMEKKANPDNKLKIDYTLTERGKELRPVLMALGKWGYCNIAGAKSLEQYIKKLYDKNAAMEIQP